MIIGVTGTTKVGKSTFIKDFIKKYNKYELLEESYRDIEGLDLYEKGTEESQRLIRDYMFKQAKEVWAKRDTKRKVIHDRTLLDNLACTMYLYSLGKISDEFLIESFEITKKAMSMYHLIYFLPITKGDKIKVPDDIDEEYRGCIDVILKTIYYAYENGDDTLTEDIFPKENCTAMEEVFGSREERIGFCSLVLDEEGEIIGEGDAPSIEEVLGLAGDNPAVAEFEDGGEKKVIDLKSFGFTDEEIEKNTLDV